MRCVWLIVFIVWNAFLSQAQPGFSAYGTSQLPVKNQAGVPRAPTLREFRQQQEQEAAILSQKNWERMGYESPPTQEQIKAGTYYQAVEQRKKLKQQEIYLAINGDEPGVRKTADPHLRIADTSSAYYKTHALFYFAAAGELSKMLSGQSKTDVKRAVFIVENAYHENKLSYAKYCKRIDTLAEACRQIISDEKLGLANPAHCHYAIQKLYSDTVFYTSANGRKYNVSLGYDFEDFWGNEDHTKPFVTKLLRTKTGQCRSLPLLYLILAGELGVPAHLSLAPNHSFVQFPLNGQWHCFETTVGKLVSRDWMAGTGYISSFAIRNKIYLAPLQQEELLAQCLTDLALGYVHKFGYDDFALSCVYAALHYWPSGISAMQLCANVGIAYCAETAGKYNFPPKEDYHKYPELKERFDFMVNMEMAIDATGFVKIPPEAYEQWQRSAAGQKRKHEHDQLTEQLKQSQTSDR